MTDDDAGPIAGQQRASAPPPPRSWSDLAAEAGSPESLTAITQADPTALSGAELVDAIVASEKALSLLTARQMGLLTEFARPGRAGDVTELVAELMDKGGQGRGPDGHIDLDTVETLVQERAASLAAAEVAAALQISPITAGSRVRKAQDLCDGLPATAAALADGRIDRGRALLIAERTAPLNPSLREAVQDRILPIAEDRSTGNLRHLLDRAVIAADPDAAENRERKAKRDRELVLRSLPDGMASVRANAPAEAALSIFTLADLLADKTGADDDRPVAARRVDAWHDIAEQLLTHGYVDLTDLLDPTTAEPVPAQSMSNNCDHPAASSPGAPATDPCTEPRSDQASSSAESHEPDSDAPDSDVRDSDESDSDARDSDEHGSDARDSGEPDTDGSDTGESDTGESDTGECDTDESDIDECDSDAPDSGAPDGSARAAAPTAINPGDSVADAATGNTADAAESVSGQLLPRSATSSTADRAGVAGRDGAVIADPAHPPFTPNPILRAADAATPSATPPAAHGLQCTTCGGHEPAGMPAGTTGNRDDRRAARRASRQGRRPHLTVTLSASTLAGLDRLPGHLEGYGAITAATALMIAQSAASITTVLLDPASGSITGTGTRTYRPSQATRDIATTLATTCRFPSCRQPAWRCDLDHRDPFDHHDPDAGGPTDPANIDPLCRSHHWLKHHSAWSSTRGPGHTQIWSSPTGHRYTDPPRTLTLPGELLDPCQAPPVRHPGSDAHDPTPFPSDHDDEGLRPDWRDAEFGGPFPDTLELKVLVTTVRNRIQRVRDIIHAPRPTRTAQDNPDHGGPSDPDAPGWDVTRPPTEAQSADPDEPPF